ncbi:MAG: LysR family transcriptional regulator [Lachnospiraceae bacterium]
MNIEKCRILLKIFEYGSLSEAAVKLGYSPSGISRMMASLEDEMGFSLFTRTTSAYDGIKPSKECQKILPEIKEFVSSGEKMLSSAANISGLISGELSVGTPFPAFFGPLYSLVTQFKNRFPNTNVTLLNSMSTKLCRAVENNEVDFCIVSYRKGNFDWIPLTHSPLVVLAAYDHPFAAYDFITTEQIRHADIITPPPKKETDCSNFLIRSEIPVDQCCICPNTSTAYYMAAAGLGIFIDCEIFASRFSDAVKLIPIKPQQTVEIGIAVPKRKNLSPAAREFIKLSRKEFTAMISSV